MRILSAIIQLGTNLLSIGGADLLYRRGIGAKPVGDDASWFAILLRLESERINLSDPSSRLIETASTIDAPLRIDSFKPQTTGA